MQNRLQNQFINDVYLICCVSRQVPKVNAPVGWRKLNGFLSSLFLPFIVQLFLSQRLSLLPALETDENRLSMVIVDLIGHSMTEGYTIYTYIIGAKYFRYPSV